MELFEQIKEAAFIDELEKISTPSLKRISKALKVRGLLGNASIYEGKENQYLRELISGKHSTKEIRNAAFSPESVLADKLISKGIEPSRGIKKTLLRSFPIRRITEASPETRKLVSQLDWEPANIWHKGQRIY